MGPGEAVRSVFGQYAGFSGTARRSEYWWFWLFYTVVIAVLYVVALATSGGVRTLFFILYIAFALVCLIPALAVAVRRLHDTDKSGWWLLIGLIPFGGLVLLVFFLLPTTTNRYTGGAPA
jgi:uncharacterized membrane protein YhaH (DUF805 family)